MKKYLFLSLAAAALIGTSGFVMAQNNMQEQLSVTTVEQIGTMNDETPVMLQGTITQSLGDNMYVFSDSTGNINIEIEEDEWNGNSFSPNMVVTINGEVDKEGNLSQIDVSEVQMAQ